VAGCTVVALHVAQAAVFVANALTRLLLLSSSSRAPPGQLGLGQFVSDECVLKPTPIYGIPTNR
jgi:hypothetical protein